jgi:hypothetical protein
VGVLESGHDYCGNHDQLDVRQFWTISGLELL